MFIWFDIILIWNSHSIYKYHVIHLKFKNIHRKSQAILNYYVFVQDFLHWSIRQNPDNQTHRLNDKLKLNENGWENEGVCIWGWWCTHLDGPIDCSFPLTCSIRWRKLLCRRFHLFHTSDNTLQSTGADKNFHRIRMDLIGHVWIEKLHLQPPQHWHLNNKQR